MINSWTYLIMLTKEGRVIDHNATELQLIKILVMHTEKSRKYATKVMHTLYRVSC